MSVWVGVQQFSDENSHVLEWESETAVLACGKVRSNWLTLSLKGNFFAAIEAWGHCHEREIFCRYRGMF